MSIKAEVKIQQEPPRRWSAQRKMEIVLRHFKGESLDALSREAVLALNRNVTLPGFLEMSPFSLKK